MLALALLSLLLLTKQRRPWKRRGGEYLQDHKIFHDVAKNAPYPPRPKYCIDHKVVWYQDYLRRESLLIEEDETVEGLVEEVAVRKKTLFVANLSPQTEILDVCRFFHNVGKVVSLRLIVNHEGKHVGCGFVEFVSANEAKKALEKKKGEYLHDHKIFLDVAKIAPYPPRTKYNLAEKLWYEDYLERESLPIEEGERPPDFVEEVAARKKTLFVGHLSRQTEILDICKFFHNVGEVVHVRLVVDHKGRLCYGFVEFASANEAKMEEW